MPLEPNRWVAPKSPNNVASFFFFFSTVHLLRKGVRFEHGGAKLVFCSGHHLTSVRPVSTEDSSQKSHLRRLHLR